MNAGFYFPKNFNQMAEMNASGKQPEESDFFWNLGNPEELKASKCRSSAKVCRKMGVKKDIKKLYMGIFALVLVAIGIFFLLTGGVPMVNGKSSSMFHANRCQADGKSSEHYHHLVWHRGRWQCLYFSLSSCCPLVHGQLQVGPCGCLESACAVCCFG